MRFDWFWTTAFFVGIGTVLSSLWWHSWQMFLIGVIVGGAAMLVKDKGWDEC